MKTKRIKKYVEVTAAFCTDGRLRPLFITWDDGREFHIDKINDIRRAASSIGGNGIRYTVLIWGKVCYLFFEDSSNLWFVEQKQVDK